MFFRLIISFILILNLLFCTSAQDKEEANETQETTTFEEPQPEAGENETTYRVDRQEIPPPEPQKDPNQVFEEMEKVYFSLGQTSLSLQNMFVLDDYVKYLRDNGSVNIILNGYTDYTSNAEINNIISQMRAENVRIYLIQNGVAPKRIVARGKGVYNPQSPYRDREGMKKSRTVEFIAR